jgi:multidrug efflux pump subunit AcrA (membrane-fusion protein)
VVRYAAYIQIENPDEKLRPGMSVDADIITKTAKKVLIVPNSSVKPYQGGRAVRVPGENGIVEYIPVEIGIRGVKNTQILKGISEGQEIITSLSNESIKRPGLF